MKRSIVAGIPKVYEIARCFRNEGMDSTHLQDFTMIECYQSYFNYRDNMIFIREMLQSIIMKLFGNLDVQMSVTIEEQKKGDEKNEVKRIIRIMVRKVYETHN